MLFSIMYFENAFLNIVTITFTTLIIIELLNVFSVVTQIKWQMIVATLGTIFLYFFSIIFFKAYMDVSAIDGPFLLNVVILTAITWAPLHLFKKIVERLDPN